MIPDASLSKRMDALAGAGTGNPPNHWGLAPQSPYTLDQQMLSLLLVQLMFMDFPPW